MLLLGHPSGNTFCRAAARAFLEVGWLQEFHSCLCWDPSTPLARRLPPGPATQLARRTFPEIPRQLQHSHPWRELGRLIAPNWPLLTRHEHGALSVDGVYRSFDRQVARRLSHLSDLRGVYLYEDAALHSFQQAARLGLRRFYDLPIGHWRVARQIFEEERERQPGWASTLTGLQDSPGKLARKDEELALADLVVVPGSYVKSTLVRAGISESSIAVVPFGSPSPLPQPVHRPLSSGPLKVLYVGSLGQRKGLSYALEAVEALGSQVSLTLIGRPTTPDCQPLNAALQRHHHLPSLPHAQILEQMRQHDVLLFPTLFDGFGLVITEAFSQGLPVITTAHSGAPECLHDGVEGYIVPIRDSQAIAERLQQLVDHPDRRLAMAEACLRRAAALSWSAYEQALRLAVAPLITAAQHKG